MTVVIVVMLVPSIDIRCSNTYEYFYYPRERMFLTHIFCVVNKVKKGSRNRCYREQNVFYLTGKYLAHAFGVNCTDVSHLQRSKIQSWLWGL